MVKGLSHFQKHFADYSDKYVLIGGTACTLVMEEVGNDFPSMLELFSRVPDSLRIAEGSHLTPIPINESITSLSAILLDDTYYQFIHAGKKKVNGLPVVNASHLIPLKARAWIDLMNRKNVNTNISERDVRKHKNDIMRLCQLLAPSDKIILPQPIKQDMKQFLSQVQEGSQIDLKSLGIKNIKFNELLATLEQMYNI